MKSKTKYVVNFRKIQSLTEIIKISMTIIKYCENKQKDSHSGETKWEVKKV